LAALNGIRDLGPQPRRVLTTDTLRRRFEAIADYARNAAWKYSMAGTFMNGYTMFATKEPPELSLENLHRERHNEKPIGIGKLPSDSQMREFLDRMGLEPRHAVFADLVMGVDSQSQSSL
jgi:hypothetical protein